MRRIAARMAEIIRAVHPTLAAFVRLPQGLDWRAIEASPAGGVDTRFRRYDREAV
jgi:hypothetical protein